MSEAYLGEIRMFGGNFAPAGWAFCNGQTLSIAQNSALFSLLGTTYGGDGQSTFLLPNLQSRLPVGQGQGGGLSSYVIGQMGGTESVTLLQTQMPQHNHPVQVSSDRGTVSIPGPTVVPAKPVSDSTTESLYSIPTPNNVVASNFLPQAIGLQGGSLPHENRMPALAVSFIIALNGIFPTRN